MNQFFQLVTQISEECNDSGIAIWRAIGNSAIGRAIINVRIGIREQDRAVSVKQTNNVCWGAVVLIFAMKLMKTHVAM